MRSERRIKDLKAMKVNKYQKIKEFSKKLTYFTLLVLRIALVFIPQYGYIHPDEFFQTSEIISGKIKHFSHQEIHLKIDICR